MPSRNTEMMRRIGVIDELVRILIDKGMMMRMSVTDEMLGVLIDKVMMISIRKAHPPRGCNHLHQESDRPGVKLRNCSTPPVERLQVRALDLVRVASLYERLLFHRTLGELDAGKIVIGAANSDMLARML